MARARLGDAAGTRVLVEVLLLHRRMPTADVQAGMTAAMRLGNLSPDVVAVEARNAGSRPDPGPVPLALVLPRRTRRRARTSAAGDRAADRPAAAAHRDPYDQLLTLDATATS